MRHVIRILLLLSFFMFGTPTTNFSNAPQNYPEQRLVVIMIDIPKRELLSKPGEEPYRVGNKLYVKVLVKNNSDQRIMVRLVDPYYQNCPQLVRNGSLIPYRKKIAELVSSKNADPEFVSLGRFVSVAPYASADLTELDLNDWFGNLEPGSYRLVNRYRLGIDGPWTADSAPLLFQVVAR